MLLKPDRQSQSNAVYIQFTERHTANKAVPRCTCIKLSAANQWFDCEDLPCIV